jgi:hypothetical protein
VLTLVFKVQFWLPSLAYVSASGELDIQKASLDFEALGWLYYQIVNWNAFNNIFVWLKGFAFLKYANKVGVMYVNSVAHVYMYATLCVCTYFEALGWLYYQIVNWNAFNNIFVWLKGFAFLKHANKVGVMCV